MNKSQEYDVKPEVLQHENNIALNGNDTVKTVFRISGFIIVNLKQ